MSELKRRKQYQGGSIRREPRKRGPDVWTFRYFDEIEGKRVRAKVILGTIEQLPTRKQAERASEHLRLAANSRHTLPFAPACAG